MLSSHGLNIYLSTIPSAELCTRVYILRVLLRTPNSGFQNSALAEHFVLELLRVTKMDWKIVRDEIHSVIFVRNNLKAYVPG